MSTSPKRSTLPVPAQLPIFEHKGQLVVDSREVAPFVEKDHAHLLRDIRKYIRAMERFNESKVGLVTETKIGFSADNKFNVKAKAEQIAVLAFAPVASRTALGESA